MRTFFRRYRSVLIVLAALLILPALNHEHVRYAPVVEWNNEGGEVLAALVIGSPFFGLIFLFFIFAGWHRRFHRRMKSEGISRIRQR